MSNITDSSIHEAVEEFSAAANVAFNDYDKPDESLSMKLDHDDGLLIFSTDQTPTNETVTVDVATDYPLIHVSHKNETEEFTDRDTAATYALNALFSE